MLIETIKVYSCLCVIERVYFNLNLFFCSVWLSLCAARQPTLCYGSTPLFNTGTPSHVSKSLPSLFTTSFNWSISSCWSSMFIVSKFSHLRLFRNWMGLMMPHWKLFLTMLPLLCQAFEFVQPLSLFYHRNTSVLNLFHLNSLITMMVCYIKKDRDENQ